jgi:hypothetical protein
VAVPDGITADNDPAFVPLETGHGIVLQQRLEKLRLDHVKATIIIHHAYQHCDLLVELDIQDVQIPAAALNW